MCSSKGVILTCCNFFSIAKNIENKRTLLQEWKNPPFKKKIMPWNGITCLKNKIISVAWSLFLKRTFNFGFDFLKKIGGFLLQI
jgi:hypothetical protein